VTGECAVLCCVVNCEAVADFKASLFCAERTKGRYKVLARNPACTNTEEPNLNS